MKGGKPFGGVPNRNEVRHCRHAVLGAVYQYVRGDSASIPREADTSYINGSYHIMRLRTANACSL